MAIVAVSGQKGGVEKSTVGHILMNHFLSQGGNAPALFDFDTSNPDIGAVYQACMKNEPGLCIIKGVDALLPEDREGLQNALVYVAEKEPDRNVILNLGARSEKEVEALAPMFRHIKPTVLWCVSPHKDSLKSLKKFLATVGETRVCAIGAGHLGGEKTYDYFRKNACNIPFEYCPKSEQTPQIWLYRKGVPMHHWSPDSGFEDRMPLTSWWETESWYAAVGKMIARALEAAAPVSALERADIPDTSNMNPFETFVME